MVAATTSQLRRMRRRGLGQRRPTHAKTHLPGVDMHLSQHMFVSCPMISFTAAFFFSCSKKDIICGDTPWLLISPASSVVCDVSPLSLSLCAAPMGLQACLGWVEVPSNPDQGF